MRSNIKYYVCWLFLWMFMANVYADGSLRVSPSSLSISAGSTGKISVTGYAGTVRATSSNVSVATVTYASGVATVKGIKAGSAEIKIKDQKNDKKVKVTVIGSQTAVMTVTPASLNLVAGSTGSIKVNNPSGTVSITNSNSTVATASYTNGAIAVKALKAGSAALTVKDSKTTLQVPVTITSTPVPPTVSGDYTLLAWNDLGMHCMDGVDFSVFTILPPYNTLHAQLKNKSGALVTSGVKLTYEAVQTLIPNPNGTGQIPSNNTYSAGKTNFWENSGKLFGLSPPTDVGLNLDGLATGTPDPGNETISLTPAPMTFNTEYQWFEAEGIPVTPFDDNGNKNFYPTVKVVARDASNNILAETTTVLPVSDEMTCKGCHASTTSTNPAQIAAKPAPSSGGWVNDPNPEKDWKRNILRLHDEKKLSNANYKKALGLLGYNAGGLLTTADSGKPVLCVACHASNAYFDKRNKVSVMQGLKDPVNGTLLARSFTQVLHAKHAIVKDPATQLALDSSGDRTACYLCHPGSKTQCLRGAMGKAQDAGGNSAMSCQSCHGNMAAVASPARQGWYNEPTCESCHNSDNPATQRYVSSFAANGLPRVPNDRTFATNLNKPVPGLNLYRFSKGHGGLQCEACHGSTHAEYPSLHADDNIQSIAVQGHEGTVAECVACHKTMPTTVNGGPHGMHSTGDAWVKAHEDVVEHGSAATLASCTYCHGTTAAGTPLSALKVAKTINAGEFGIKNWPKGYQVSCYSCHNGPDGD